jgi:hypothetical protein
MKKFRFFFFLTLLCSAFILINCKKSDSNNDLNGNCEALADDASNAASDFIANMSEATCNDYVDAIDDYYNGCDLIPQSEKDSYDQWLNSVDCSLYGNN